MLSQQTIDADAEVLARPDPGTHLYVCGPTGFIDHVINTAKSLNWNSGQIHLEYFGAAPVATTGDTEFAVQIASTGKSYTVPADRTVGRYWRKTESPFRSPASRAYAAPALHAC